MPTSLGVTAALLGICSELGIRNILAVQVSPHTRRTIEEHDAARRLMFAARAGPEPAEGLRQHAARAARQEAVSGRRPRRSRRLRARCATRISASRPPPTASMSTTATAITSAQDALSLFPKLGVESDGAHAFYLGTELMKAETALQPRQALRAGRAARLGRCRRPPGGGSHAACQGGPHAARQEGRLSQCR